MSQKNGPIRIPEMAILAESDWEGRGDEMDKREQCRRIEDERE